MWGILINKTWQDFCWRWHLNYSMWQAFCHRPHLIYSKWGALCQRQELEQESCFKLWGFLVGFKSLLLGVCSWHIFCYGQMKVRVIWLVEGLMCPSAKQYLSPCLEAQRSRWLNIHILLSAIFFAF